MTNHDDFLDEYIEYRIFEESMNDSGRRSPKKNSGCGCLMIAIVVCIVIAVIMICGLFWG